MWEKEGLFTNYECVLPKPSGWGGAERELFLLFHPKWRLVFVGEGRGVEVERLPDSHINTQAPHS